MPQRPTYRPRKFFCANPINAQCRKGFLTRAGLTNHRNAVHTNLVLPPSRIPQYQLQPMEHHHFDNNVGQQPDTDVDSRSDSNNAPPLGAYFVRHSVIDGTPCDMDDNDLNGSQPLPHEKPKSPWHPFANRGHFSLADFVFRHNKMPGTQFDELMHIWAKVNGSEGGSGKPPPYANKKDLYDTIDAIDQGDVPWQSFTVQHGDVNSLTGDLSAPQWKLAEYDVWFRDPRMLLRNQLSNPDFKDGFDHAPHQVYGNNHERVFGDFMSGNWAWNQCNELSEDPECHGAMFVPVILGSDKTTVSVATGNSEYYPLYISNGNVHNNIRRAHVNAVSLVGFLAIPKSDREHQNDQEFRDFRRHLFHRSLEAILSSLRPAMTTPEVTLCPDGHYCRTIYGLRPYIADYPEQCLLSCIVQGWCPRCTASRKDLDEKNAGHLRTHEFIELLRGTYAWKVLWDNWGIVDDIMPFTASFPRANIHELLSPDLLHQVIKGSFKDHLVTWVEKYLAKTFVTSKAAATMAEIDRRVSAAPSFPGLRHFPEGRHFKQWTGNDSKALMKVFLPAITGLVPDQMADLDALDDALARFHKERNIFIDSGVMPDGISLPRQHALMHYRTLIELYGAPNGLCLSITESKHIKAIKKPWRRSNCHLPLGQMLLINQRLNKLAAFKSHLAAHRFLNPASLEPADIDPGDFEDLDDEFDPEEAHFRDDSNLEDVEPDTELTRYLREYSAMEYPRRLPEIAAFINFLNLPELRNPNASIQAADIVDGRVDVFNSAVATFRAPSDICGVNAMQRQRIHSCRSWYNGPARHDCVFAEKDPSLPGFQGLYVAQLYPCALPCKSTGMWMVEPELDDDSGEWLVSVIHLDSIMRAAHLIGVYGSQDIPHHLKHTDSLVAFSAYYVNKFSDYHAYEITY
ncbi:uncharacterized protein F5891DRAFT_1130081 [Suillus fuscotomentosus]|uniref:C2H2-type domain-containing protein n=1 Tax=Suillus fuscotomentosus TaxID=1912939 RepID=A0AAD4HIS5_9AGAM|nr:uncharacterized protein F5891DRAFT_1130081 [Suillus fuscotomentosus]KAG1897029.1 hypothetical protein F5891DRAFT_1130081 [Suillus fuscotomentosus]